MHIFVSIDKGQCKYTDIYYGFLAYKSVRGSYLKPQKSMFKSWDSHAVWTWLITWQSLSGPRFVCMMLHGKGLWPWLIVSKILCTSMTLWRRYDVWKFGADTILFREIQCKKRDILVFNPFTALPRAVLVTKTTSYTPVPRAPLVLTRCCLYAFF